MENATKALLIAAAVLIAILIISLGLVIYNRASETVNSAGDLSEYEVQQHNEKFTKYEGLNLSGSEVNAMINTVHNYNLINELDSRIQVTDTTANNVDIVPGNYGAGGAATTRTPEKVPTGDRFAVWCTLENGMVTTITIYPAGTAKP